MAEAGTAAAAIFLRDAVTTGLWGDETEAANVKSFQVDWLFISSAVCLGAGRCGVPLAAA